MIWDVVVIGAGLAGLTCARSLHRQGYRVLVVEKSRGLGGRLSTRRVNGIPVDHGCRFLQPTTPLMQELIAELQPQVLVPWQPQAFQLDAQGNLSSQPLQAPLFVAPAGMSAVAKYLAQGIEILQQRRAIALQVTSAATWQVAAESTAQPVAEARSLVLAIPAPQAAELLSATETAQDWQPRLQAVSYVPCLSVMAGFDPDRPVGPGSGSQGWVVWGNGAGAIAWAALDSAKPGRAEQTVVLHSSAAFACQYLDAQDLSAAADQLIAAARPFLGQAPIWQQIHRWRYSTVAEAVNPAGAVTMFADRPSGAIAAPLPLVCCGDWCCGQDAAAALASGQKAARQMHARLRETN